MLIAVDFDGTIVEHAYPAIGRPIPFAIDVLKQLQADGHLLVLWTFRYGDKLDEAVRYCHDRGVDFYAVNRAFPEEEWDPQGPRKLDADLFIDDRNLGGLPDWGEIYHIIKYGNTPGAQYGNPRPAPQPKQKQSLLSKLFGQ